jgi:hypothetical protein
MPEQAIATDSPLTSTTSAPPKSGFLYEWGPQAWIDMWMSKTMLVKNGLPLVSHSFLPILRLSGDKEQIDRGYKEIRSRREVVGWRDSPREKWRKRYGNLVREMEWALLELRKLFSQKQYEEIVIGTCVAVSEETSANFIAMMNKMGEKNRVKDAEAPTGDVPPTRWEKLWFDMLNPAGFLTGPAVVRSMDKGAGTMTMYVPDCAWHTCAKAESLPRPDQLPAEGCQMICKGAFEALFNGAGNGLGMDFEPHLPETSCTIRMWWKPQAAGK